METTNRRDMIIQKYQHICKTHVVGDWNAPVVHHFVVARDQNLRFAEVVDEEIVLPQRTWSVCALVFGLPFRTKQWRCAVLSYWHWQKLHGDATLCIMPPD